MQDFPYDDASLAAQFAREHYDDVYRYCYRRLNSKDDAQDATQEVFLRLVKSNALYVEYGKPLAYLYACARHVCADFHRGRKPVSASLEECAIDVLDKDSGRMERHLIMEDALARLTDEEREVMELRYGQDLSVADIASAMGKSRFAVHRLERKALSTLKAMFGEADE